MIYFAAGLIVVWAAGFLFLLGRAFDLGRRALNNPASNEPYWDDADYVRFYFRFFRRRSVLGLAVDSAKLTETGRQYQKRAIRAEWLTVTWAAIGIIPVVWACSYLMAP